METILDDAQVARFSQAGYLVLEAWLDPALCPALIAEAAAHEDGGRSRPAFDFPTHAWLTSHPPLMAVMQQLLGPEFLFHHVHAARHGAGADGVPWHNDYEQVPQVNRSHAQVIALVYPDGLRREVGDLVVVPCTQRIACDWQAMSVFGTATLPGEVLIDRLTPGSIVLAHTGLLHCRRPRGGPGPRYFSDLSYCARGIRWPSWSEGDWHAMYRHLRGLGCGRAGRFDHLYDESSFFDQREARDRLAALGARGSLLAPP